MNLQLQQYGRTALNDTAIRAYAPSAFATSPAPGLSTRYGFVPTADVIEGLRGDGWNVVNAHQHRVRAPDAESAGYVKHVLRFERSDVTTASMGIGDCVPQLVLTNSHDGSSQYTLEGGLFRLVCLNGLLCATKELQMIRIRHSINVVKDVVEASRRVVDVLPQIGHAVARFAGITLLQSQRLAFATDALRLRYGEGETWRENTSLSPDQLLEARRSADAYASLWLTYNTVQENLMRGGLAVISKTGRHAKTRGIFGLSVNLRVNRGLWQLTERYAGMVDTVH